MQGTIERRLLLVALAILVSAFAAVPPAPLERSSSNSATEPRKPMPACGSPFATRAWRSRRATVKEHLSSASGLHEGRRTPALHPLRCDALSVRCQTARTTGLGNRLHQSEPNRAASDALVGTAPAAGRPFVYQNQGRNVRFAHRPRRRGNQVNANRICSRSRSSSRFCRRPVKPGAAAAAGRPVGGIRTQARRRWHLPSAAERQSFQHRAGRYEPHDYRNQHRQWV